MGEHGTLGGRFRKALRVGAFPAAMRLAAELPRVGLEDAAELTALAVVKDASRYPALARRLLVRLIEERQLAISELASLVDTMAAAQRMAAAENGEDAAAMLRSALMRKIEG